MSNDLSNSSNLNEFMCFNLYKGWREVKAFYQDILGSDISPQNVFILLLCDLNKPLTMQQLADRMELDGSAISTLVSRMEKKSLLIRKHGKEDRRVVFVQLTKEGFDLRESLQEKINLIAKSITNNVREEDQRIFKDVIGTISENRSNLSGR